MKTAEVISINGHQAVRLPDEYRFADDTISIRKEGSAVILEPLKPVAWPPDFFERVRINDPAFERPPQGEIPPPPAIG